MLMSRSAINPPTITMAKGRCESDPISRERAAGNKPRAAGALRKAASGAAAAALLLCFVGLLAYRLVMPILIERMGG